RGLRVGQLLNNVPDIKCVKVKRPGVASSASAHHRLVIRGLPLALMAAAQKAPLAYRGDRRQRGENHLLPSHVERGGQINHLLHQVAVLSVTEAIDEQEENGGGVFHLVPDDAVDEKG